ncbi:MAG: nucleotidyltransferase [Planctomycetes bacterium]|nr:nucleotidyltransferase [Planctomycetota bacterium]
MRRVLDLDRRAFVEALADALDLPASKYKDAQSRYEAVATWLNADDSPIAQYSPAIYPQGSFALGTATQPFADDQYDVDAVCRLRLFTHLISQRQLKDMVGARLKAHGVYAKMLDPREGGRRCWTLMYADESGFHLDILPAIPDDPASIIALGVPERHAAHAIQVTDKLEWDRGGEWPKSNPQGYVGWFQERMRTASSSEGRLFAARAGTVKPVAEDAPKSPLQRVVQLLKRHRDVRYHGDPDKPASIILTTLAARAYRGEAGLLDALAAVIPGMRSGIEHRDDGDWVENPVNPKENFAERWKSYRKRKANFYEWLDSVEADYQGLLAAVTEEELEDRLREAYGERALSAAQRLRTERAGGASGVAFSAAMARVTDSAERSALARFNVPHRQRPTWVLAGQYRVSIKGRYKHMGVWRDFASDSPRLPKNCDLIFQASTSAPLPYQVHWQIVNTGDEAARDNGLRGNFIESQELGAGGLTRHEATRYRGTHWVQCFIVNRGRCIARSPEFVVNIE